ncbi:hypothetical protein ACLI4U_05935 [Natrialbaceae archaeon A-CW2]|uniref:hypothetical protein n=1 Tax=Natronosalvus amylolyticus TaxID=2961994 RepID=UPI0020C945C3|nr:hypothetical protein [Natronosalvus amylolyticus]
MTTGPKLRLGKTLVPGVLAVVLFALMGVITLNTGFGTMTGYPEGISITSEIGYAMFDMTALQSGAMNIGDTEPFLVSFLLIAVVLDAALDASLVLAKREDAGEPVTALSTTPTDADSSGTAAADGGVDQ